MQAQNTSQLKIRLGGTDAARISVTLLDTEAGQFHRADAP
jgi:hypothetical protein